MLGIPIPLIMSYAVFQVFLYYLRKHREVFMAERFPGMRMRGFEKVMFAWILLNVLFQAAFLIYFAATVGIVRALLLFVLSFVLSLLFQVVPLLVLKRSTPMLMALLSFPGMPVCAVLMINAIE